MKCTTNEYQLINSPHQLQSALKPFLKAKIIGLDCETTGLDPYQAQIRTIQLAIPHHRVLVIDLFALKNPQKTTLKLLFASSALKIGHNLKFEWLMLQQAGFNLSPPFFDTYLAYQVLTAGLKQASSLQVICAKLLHIKLDKSLQNSNWSGILT